MASELPTDRELLTSPATEKAKKYILNKEIPQLFEALMTSLMYNQPDDHVDYLIKCLQRLKQNGKMSQREQLKWNTFITDNHHHKQTQI
jgi:hypothetical protein